MEVERTLKLPLLNTFMERESEREGVSRIQANELPDM